MAAPIIPPQEHFFYQGAWNATADKCLLQSLLVNTFDLKWDGGEIPARAIELAKFDLKFFNSQDVSIQQIVQRINFMEKRYKTFNAITNNPKFRYRYGDPIVVAEEKSWEKLFQKNSLARAYFYKIEPEWDQLIRMYCSCKRMNEGNETDVIISDSTNELEESKHATHGIGEEDEVTSPHLKSTRRKLFAELDGSDAISTSGINEPPRNSIPPRIQGKITKVAKGSKNTSSSSCASSSPNYWNNNPFV